MTTVIFLLSIIFLYFPNFLSKERSDNKDSSNKTTHSIKMPRQNILLLGDSITQRSYEIETQGWGAQLNDWYMRSGDVVNRGFSGYTSRWIRVILPKLLPLEQTPKFNLATLLLGSNDAASDNSMQHVPLDEFKDNMIYIINYLKSINPDMVIILITPPPNNQDKIDPNWDRRVDIKKYEQAAVEVATKLRVDLLSLWEGRFAIDPKQDLHEDGLHFHVVSNRKVADGVKHIIETKHPNLLPGRSHSFPDFFEFIGKDPKAIVDLLDSWSAVESAPK